MRIQGLVVTATAAVVFACASSARAGVRITIDKSTQQMTVSVDGVPQWTWPVSTGRAGYDTPNGTFKAFRMEADHYSKEWDDAPMPHSIFFTKVGHAIHGYLDTRRIGSPASHGCVRLAPANAAKLFALVEQQGVLNTTVVLTGDVAVARRGAPRPADDGVAINTRPSLGAPLVLQPDDYRPPQYPQVQHQPQYQPQYQYRPTYQPQYQYQYRQDQPDYQPQYQYRQPRYQGGLFPFGY